ncbi:MAG: hypothetical protein KJN65_02170 [Croceitalea sp.]|nr:hypothetical protein [Croceitalea sp.]NNC35245.1 hypothetical protein [Croceitalea sp.]
MFLKYVLLGSILLCATCCPEDDCAAVLCEGPPILGFEVIKDNENVFLNDTYTLADVTIDGENIEGITLSLANSDEPSSILVLENNGWGPGTFEYILNFSTDASIPLKVNIKNSPSGGCCGGIARLEQLTINGQVQEKTFGFQIILD